MIAFTDGPAEGVSLPLRRLPAYLRLVRTPDTGWHALDGLEDEVESHEEVVVYRLTSRSSDAPYAVVAPQPDEKVLRDTEKWRAWAAKELASAKPPADAVLWRKAYYRALNGKQTFRQAEVGFFREYGRWPPRNLPLMPLHLIDWFSKVGTVGPERLIGREKKDTQETPDARE